MAPSVSVPQLPVNIPDVGALLGILFLVVFTCWAIFTVVNFYHWFRYSRHSIVMIPALVVYLFVSLFLLLFTGVGTIL